MALKVQTYEMSNVNEYRYRKIYKNIYKIYLQKIYIYIQKIKNIYKKILYTTKFTIINTKGERNASASFISSPVTTDIWTSRMGKEETRPPCQSEGIAKSSFI